MENHQYTFSERLKKELVTRQLSRQVIAKELHCTEATIGHWLSGKLPYSIHQLAQLRIRYGIDLNKLLVGDETMTFELIKSSKMDWGSCQYDAATDLFKSCQQYKENGGDVKKEFKVTYTRVLPLDEAWKEFAAWLRDPVTQEQQLPGFNPYYKEYQDEVKSALEREPSYANMFEILADIGWDLWSAAPHIAHTCFSQLELDCPVLFDETGLYCWLLYDAGVITSEESFTGFST